MKSKKSKSKATRVADRDGVPSFMMDEVSVGAPRAKSAPPKSGARVKSKGETVESLAGKSLGKLNVDTSIVDFLKSVGEDSSFEARKSKAKEYGIEGDYTGSAKQNVAMLKAAKERAKAPKNPGITPPASSPDGVDVPESVDSEDAAVVDRQLLEQNRDYIEPSDLQDGTWDQYVSFVQKMRKERPESTEGLPNFQEYLRYSEGMA